MPKIHVVCACLLTTEICCFKVGSGLETCRVTSFYWVGNLMFFLHGNTVNLSENLNFQLISYPFLYRIHISFCSVIYQQGAPASAHSIVVRHSLNSLPPRAAARITACTPSTTKIEVKIEIYGSYL